MAVTRTGSVTEIESTANTGSQSVTVPADAEVMMVGVSGGTSGGTSNYFSGGSCTIGGASLTLGRDDDNTGARISQCIFYKITPATGAQTFAWDWAGTAALGVGGHIHIAFYKGIHASTPIGATGGLQDTDSDATTGSLTATNGDAVFCIGSGYGSTGTPTDLSWTNATELDDDTFTSLRGACAEAFPAGNVTVTVTQSGGTGTKATTISAIVITQAAGAAGHPTMARWNGIPGMKLSRSGGW